MVFIKFQEGKIHSYKNFLLFSSYMSHMRQFLCVYPDNVRRVRIDGETYFFPISSLSQSR